MEKEILNLRTLLQAFGFMTKVAMEAENVKSPSRVV
jgi:hypothetical protein